MDAPLKHAKYKIVYYTMNALLRPGTIVYHKMDAYGFKLPLWYLQTFLMYYMMDNLLRPFTIVYHIMPIDDYGF